MRRVIFTKFIQKEKSLWAFSLNYNYILLCLTLPLITAGKKIFERINQKLLYSNLTEKFLFKYLQPGNIESNLTFLEKVLHFIFCTSLICTLVIIFIFFIGTHINFLKKYTSKNLKIHRSGRIIDDIKFIAAFFLVCLPFNVMIQLFSVKELIYRILSIYLVQTPILYLMLKPHWFGYKISKRSYILKN